MWGTATEAQRDAVATVNYDIDVNEVKVRWINVPEGRDRERSVAVNIPPRKKLFFTIK